MIILKQTQHGMVGELHRDIDQDWAEVLDNTDLTALNVKVIEHTLYTARTIQSLKQAVQDRKELLRMRMAKIAEELKELEAASLNTIFYLDEDDILSPIVLT